MGHDGSSPRRATRSKRSRSASASSRSRSRSRSRRRHRSRSSSRDRGSRRGRHTRSRRSRSRERHHHGSSRKRSRRERSRSVEARRRRPRRDSSPRDDEKDRRRRHGSDSAAARTSPTAERPRDPSVALPAPSLPTAAPDKPASEATHDMVVDKEDTPASQDSTAISTATTTTSSQSDVENASQPQHPSKPTVVEEDKKTPVGIAVATKNPAPVAAKVDVKAIKMDILKALADARSTIAGIKGAVPPTSATPLTVPKPVSPPQACTPENGADEVSKTTEATAGLPRAESKQSSPPAPTVAVDPVSTTKQAVPPAEVDEFDMFSAAELHGAGHPLSPAAAPATLVVGAAVQSNFDDADGYYKPNIGEILNSKYRVMGTVGKGVFSTVLRCQRLTSTAEDDPEIVAIKLIRNNEIMREASQTEIKILTHLSKRDPRDKKHCVRLLDRFDHRNHVALVFESMQMNVREAMKKFGGKGGISIQAVRIFCKHLLIALTHLEACEIVHADIKPDNVLLDEKQTMIKLCDFGSAFESKEGKHDPTPYLVSRFYRAPEIVLGLPYDKAVDMWSVGCCLYEMFTGKVMFPGATNNEMLKRFMELKGKVPNKIIKKHRQAYIEQFQMEPHFTEDNKFCSHEVDRVTGKPVLRLLDAIKTRFDLSSALLAAKSSTDDRKQVLELKSLLERMFTLDPTKRITPKEALAHPFVKTEGKHAM